MKKQQHKSKNPEQKCCQSTVDNKMFTFTKLMIKVQNMLIVFLFDHLSLKYLTN